MMQFLKSLFTNCYSKHDNNEDLEMSNIAPAYDFQTVVVLKFINHILELDDKPKVNDLTALRDVKTNILFSPFWNHVYEDHIMVLVYYLGKDILTDTKGRTDFLKKILGKIGYSLVKKTVYHRNRYTTWHTETYFIKKD